MRSNPLLKWLLIPVAVLAVFVVVRLLSGNADTPAMRDGSSDLTPDEMRSLGIGGDTPRDTVATLVAQVRQLRDELQRALEDNRAQRAENQRLRTREGAIDQRIETALDGERSRLERERAQLADDRQQTEGLLHDLQRRIEDLAGRGGDSDLPIGLGLDDGDTGAVRWIRPDDAPSEGDGAQAARAFPTGFGAAGRASPDEDDAAADPLGDASPPATPVYTVPTNATLMGSVAMTALIGRVPIDGTVNDPFPFKVLIGPDNLTANGIDIPDVAGAVVSGTASGDWTLSCVRGQIRSVTFVFDDGTIRTVPEDSERGDRQQAADTGTQGGLGWISDPYGIPCVSGHRRSNAQQYLGTQALLTAAGAGVAALIRSDRSVVVSEGGSVGTVGISGSEAMDRILAGGVQDMSSWVNQLYGQAFAAVYVQPGARVAVHIDRPLHIDHDPVGRRVDHRIGEAHATDLD
ncbi:TIGR03752 family integrating conjugative element protein [Luteimonas sp. XNQY3]|nr:TIGR03752 family integrating conjugative element protein [Luteimonas sp. XNQY3]MCD9007477.1 TIGR03752 family integrating conjugative element protein [Luteimonas sp. XNQY3]